MTELVRPPEQGRVYAQPMRPGLADCAPSGRIRLDGLARWLQEIAYFDVEEAGLAQSAAWVVRRTRLRIGRFPRFAEHFEVRTFCSGLGRMWGERRTTIARAAVDGGEIDVEAVSLWVHLDPASWRPIPFSEAELAIFGDAMPGRRITARLRHPSPDSATELARFRFRASECDLAGHINNAAYWQAIEEELLGEPGGAEALDGLDAEMEYRAPAHPGEKLILGHGDRRWIADGDGEVHASILLRR
ncbi:MAG: thioesterase [Actinomycetota bacterium]|nr:thioesterase [Actinomycetota bacterium]